MPTHVPDDAGSGRAAPTAPLSPGAPLPAVDELEIAPSLDLPPVWAAGVNAVASALRVLVGTLLVGLLVVLAWNIAVRVLNLSGYDIPTEIITLGFTWMVFVGAAVLVHEWQNIEVPVVFLLLRGPRARLVAHAAIVLVCLALALVLVGSSWKLVGASAGRASPMLHLPTPIWYASVLVGFALISLSLIVRLVGYARQAFAPPPR